MRILAALLALSLSAGAEEEITAIEESDRLVFRQGANPVGEFLFDHPRILRPGFANLRAPGGILVTRNFPPVEGIDETDHADLHPGLWLGFGDISGEDFWRNKGRIEHDCFTGKPEWKDGRLSFATKNTFVTTRGTAIADMTNRFLLSPQGESLCLEWDAEITPTVDGFYFGDQEEMGLGVRVATEITEKNGGLITNSEGLTTAAKTWGQPAAWCEYSGSLDGHRVGIMVVPDHLNPHRAWWHNRDYGVFVANPFGRKAMKQGETSRIGVKRGETYRMKFVVILRASKGGEKPE